MNTGIVINTDEVLLASLRAAGEIFRGYHLPCTADPVIVTIGAQDLLGPKLWVGDIDVPYPDDAPPPWKRAHALGATDFLHTVRYRFDMGRNNSSVSRRLIPRVPQPCSPVPGLTYDWNRGLMVIDTPTAKAAVGFIDESVSFADKIELTNVADIDPRFLSFALVSTDGQPLPKARRALLVMTTYGENPDRTLWPDPDAVGGYEPRFAKLVKSWGRGPPGHCTPVGHDPPGRRLELARRGFHAPAGGRRPKREDDSLAHRYLRFSCRVGSMTRDQGQELGRDRKTVDIQGRVTLDRKRLQQNVRALALPDGRQVGTPGHAEARRFVVRRMNEFGLHPYQGDSFELSSTRGGDDRS